MNTMKNAQIAYDDFYQMLSDQHRMDAYQRAIRQVVKADDVVVDLGAGTGILGFLALKAGAKKVYAIEKSESIELAKAIAHQNGVSHQVEFINENSKDVTLPELADIIISETLGSFGVDENTLEFTCDARDRLLKPGGVLLPHAIKLYLTPVEAVHCYKKIDFWRQINGIDFMPAFDVFSKKIMVESIQKKHFLAESQLFKAIDFYQAGCHPIESKNYFNIFKKGIIHGVAGWFDLALTDSEILSTSPLKPVTHWKQAFFPIREPVNVIPGDVMELVMSVMPQSQDSDNTTISYQYRCTQLALEKTQTEKTGRNDPCVCGSGKKYKKCCGQN